MKKRKQQKFWTQQEIDYLHRHFPHEKTADIAAHLSRTYTSVVYKASSLGLYKSKEFLNSPKCGRLRRETGKAFWFKKGSIPWNKGTKGIHIGGTETQFSPGYLPHNTLSDGHISTRYHNRDARPYKYIRISKGKWELLHRHIWRQHHGKIPHGGVITFIDGDSTNCDISNLTLITRQKNMQLNTIHRLPPPIKDTITALQMFNKTLKKVSNA